MEKKAGDWNCSKCNEVNFASRQQCRKCNTKKPMKPGDWDCPSCKEVNFASRKECRKCQTACPSKKPKIQRKEGDWDCSKCNTLNFGNRLHCYKCEQPKAPIKESEECAVCYENKSNAAISLCGHTGFCYDCLLQYSSCPACRVEYKQENVIKIFNIK